MCFIATSQTKQSYRWEPAGNVSAHWSGFKDAEERQETVEIMTGAAAVGTLPRSNTGGLYSGLVTVKKRNNASSVGSLTGGTILKSPSRRQRLETGQQCGCAEESVPSQSAYDSEAPQGLQRTFLAPARSSRSTVNQIVGWIYAPTEQCPPVCRIHICISPRPKPFTVL